MSCTTVLSYSSILTARALALEVLHNRAWLFDTFLKRLGARQYTLPFYDFGSALLTILLCSHALLPGRAKKVMVSRSLIHASLHLGGAHNRLN